MKAFPKSGRKPAVFWKTSNAKKKPASRDIESAAAIPKSPKGARKKVSKNCSAKTASAIEKALKGFPTAIIETTSRKNRE